MATHTVQFNKDVTFTSHAGVTFVNTTTAETATLVSSAAVSPASLITYTLTWVTDPVSGDVVTWEYDGTGNYVDNSGDDPVSMDAQTLTLRNCLTPLGTYQASIYQGTKTTSSTERTEKLATGVTGIRVQSNAGTGVVTISIDGVEAFTVDDGQTNWQSVSGEFVSWSSVNTGTIELGQGRVV